VRSEFTGMKVLSVDSVCRNPTVGTRIELDPPSISAFFKHRTKQVKMKATYYIYIREILRSNLRQETSMLIDFFCGLTQLLQKNAGVGNLLRHFRFFSNSFRVIKHPTTGHRVWSSTCRSAASWSNRLKVTNTLTYCSLFRLNLSRRPSYASSVSRLYDSRDGSRFTLQIFGPIFSCVLSQFMVNTRKFQRF
jgi:hypothetical protein